jgi:iron complex outermembrane recepter protein
MNQRALSATIDWSLGGFDLTSITARREWDWNPENDGDDTAVPAITRQGLSNRQTQTSQELRASSSGVRRVDYVAGLYHFTETVDGTGVFELGSAAPQWFYPPTAPQSRAAIDTAVIGLAVGTLSISDTRSNAAFGNAVWHVTEAFDVTAGLRYTTESRSGRFEQSQAGQSLASLSLSDAAAAQGLRDSFGPVISYGAETDDDDLSGTVTLSYETRRGANYLTVTDGHKAGGLNLGNFPPDIDLVVRPERVRHYEIGAKNRVGANALLNVAVYRTEVADYQTSAILPNAAGRLIQYISNIDEALSQGFELDFTWSPHRRFVLSAALAYVDASYESFPRGPCPTEISVTPAQCDLSEQRLPGSPRRAVSLGIEGAEPMASALELYWRFDYNHRSDVYTSVSNSRYSRLDELDLANLGIGIRDTNRRWDFMYWVRNVLDEDYFTFAQGRTNGWIVGLPGEPRTSGFTYRGRF